MLWKSCQSLPVNGFLVSFSHSANWVHFHYVGSTRSDKFQTLEVVKKLLNGELRRPQISKTLNSEPRMQKRYFQKVHRIQKLPEILSHAYPVEGSENNGYRHYPSWISPSTITPPIRSSSEPPIHLLLKKLTTFAPCLLVEPMHHLLQRYYQQ